MFLFTRHESPLPMWGKAVLGVAIWAAVIGWGEALDPARVQGMRTILPRAPGARIAV